MDKSAYDWYKAHGICPKCGRREADQGFVWCVVCRAKYRALYNWKSRRSYIENPEMYRDFARRRRARYSAAGLCTQCGKRPPREGLQSCQECADQRKLRRMRQAYRQMLETEKAD